MKMELSPAQGRVLHGLLEDSAGDIVLAIDAKGFIAHASSNIERIGVGISAMLLPPRLPDLAQREFGHAIEDFLDRVMRGERVRQWIEFPIGCGASGPESDDQPIEDGSSDAWFALSLRRVAEGGQREPGAVGLLRSVDKVRRLEDEVFSRSLTDPLTGLVNRQVFYTCVRSELASGAGGTVVLFAIDSLRSLFLQYGQQAADEVQWAFSKFLESFSRPGFELAQIDGERFAVLLPGLSPRSARAWAEEVLRTLSALAVPMSSRSPQLSASAGLARIERSADWTLRQAEVALVMAQAGGGMKVSQCGHRPLGVARQPG